jgi:hypothetical protein
MWRTIDGFIVSNFAKVFVKELVKEVSKTKKPALQKVKHTTSAPKKTMIETQKPLTFAKGHVMVFEWVPTSKQETNDPETKDRGAPSAGG